MFFFLPHQSRCPLSWKLQTEERKRQSDCLHWLLLKNEPNKKLKRRRCGDLSPCWNFFQGFVELSSLKRRRFGWRCRGVHSSWWELTFQFYQRRAESSSSSDGKLTNVFFQSMQVNTAQRSEKRKVKRKLLLSHFVNSTNNILKIATMYFTVKRIENWFL